jgi:indoleamine 2,3-dioxygenase
MEYAQSYALFNYNRIDKNKGLEYENLKIVRKFSGMPSEDGFILVVSH